MEIGSDFYRELESITLNCKKCGGTGFHRSARKGRVQCTCVAKITKALALHKANIPVRYQNFDKRKLTSAFKAANKRSLDLFKEQTDDINAQVRNGSLLWLFSKPGLAKSSLVGWVLSRALDQGAVPYYLRADRLAGLRMDAGRDSEAKATYQYIIDDVDVLAIEEIEKVYLPGHMTYPAQSFYSALADIYDTAKFLIVTSNEQPVEVLRMFPDYLGDRFTEKSVQIGFSGKSGRSSHA